MNMASTTRITRKRKHVVEVGISDASLEEDWLEEEEEDSDVEPNVEPGNARKPPLAPKRKASTRKPSMVWEHFTKDDPSNMVNPKCYCNYCHQEFACAGKANDTSHLIYHVKTSCRPIPRESDKKQKCLAFTKLSESEGSNALIAWKFNKDECRKSLARMLIIDELPFSFVEGEGFLDFCQNMCPRFEVPSRRTICRDVLNLYGDTKDYLKTMFSSCLHGVCLTTDTWTSCQNVNYMVLTAHFIDNDWKLHKRILNFCVITSHNLSRMARSMKQKFDKYWGNIGSMNKVLFITCVLDPRYKLQFLKLCLEDMYDKEVAQDILADVKRILVRFFDFYATDSTFGMQSCDEPQPTDPSSSVASVVSGDSVSSIQSRRMNTFLKQVEQEDNEANEIERYLNEPVEKPKSNFDILLWWKVNGPKYRVLSLVARDLLAIPVSTVASESAFSTRGRVIDPFRSSLSPRMVEALVTTQNWLRSNPIFVDHRFEVPLDDVSYYDVAFSEFVRGRDLETSLSTDLSTDNATSPFP